MPIDRRSIGLRKPFSLARWTEVLDLPRMYGLLPRRLSSNAAIGHLIESLMTAPRCGIPSRVINPIIIIMLLHLKQSLYYRSYLQEERSKSVAAR
ncbi:hypothetical protein KC359_g127 [Hortaea werneckii]|nr:hypothetical protein KC359_g127 [Hortaea werneckii]